MSNMRQRIPKVNQSRPSPGREGQSKQSSNWEITSDDVLTDFGSSGGEVSNVSMGSIPMYNPLHYQSFDNSMIFAAPAPSSNPLPREVVMVAKKGDETYLLKSKDHLIPRPPGHTLSGGFIGLRSAHLPSLSPAFIPDSGYQAYLMGRPKTKRKAAVDNICMAKFCAKFSLVAVIFLTFVGILIDTQPMYLPGIVPKHILYTTGDRKPQVFYAVDISDRLQPASHAYRAALLYLVTACISMGYAYNAHWWFKSRWQNYHDVPDNDSTVTTFHNVPWSSIGDGSVLPTSVKRKNYLHQRWESLLVAFRWVGIYLASIWPEFQERRRNRRQRFAGAKDV